MFLISIPKPCRENWNKMSPTQQGAFCSTCSETVVDFTKLSDEEVKNYLLQQQEQNTCGRFSNDQLKGDENLLPRLLTSRIPLWKKFLGIVFILFSSFLSGCMGKVQVAVPSKEIKKNKNHIPPREKDVTVTINGIQK